MESNMWIDNYKQGLERISIVLFVTVAAGFTLVRLIAGEPPSGDTPEAEAIARGLARECERPDKWQLFSFMCDERVLAEFHLKRFFDRVGLAGAAAVALVAGGVGYIVIRWTREGFREGFREDSRED